MATIRPWLASLPAIDTRSIGDVEQEILDELEFHLEMRTMENLRGGMQPEAARAAAAAQFGDLQQIQHECRRTLLGERIMLQKLQIVMTVLLLGAVVWLAYQMQAAQRATQSSLVVVAEAIAQLGIRQSESSTPIAETNTAPAAVTRDWRTERPQVVATVPEAGAADVDPETTEIRVTFNKEMKDGNWSWVQTSDDTFPTATGKIHYQDDHKTCVMPVKLQPGRKYVIWFNTAKFQNFKDPDGRPAEPYLLTFTTRQ